MTTKALLVTPEGVARVQDALRERGLEGWLLCEFHGQNPVSRGLLGLEWTTRRSFVLVPAEGEPTALIHAIEHSSWAHWPRPRVEYAGWRDMEARLPELLGGRRRLAMEVSPGNAVPTLDLTPSGLLELLEGLGVEPVGSGDLVTTFYSVWSDEQLREHRANAEIVKAVARAAFERAAEAVRAGAPATEGALAAWIREELGRRGLTYGVDCIVAIGPRAADPHYDPGEVGETIEHGQVLLIDLWGKATEDGVPADQTWMGVLDDHVPEAAQRVWEAVRDARDAAVRFLRERAAAGEAVRGFEVDDVARGVIRERGWGDAFVHRTGHSIDRDLHGSGPNLDNLETRDDRTLVTGVGFSIEPGVYLRGDLGVRSEINVHWGADGPLVTPEGPQSEMFVLL
ncbi:MAG: M24 family metallopeptidase [Gemmatimonadetes bacterium]|nr:MAG: M24 family metallopeptidase [Gemmatimonadota bacterium]